VLALEAPLRAQVSALVGVPDGTPAVIAIGATAAPITMPDRSSEWTEGAFLARGRYVQ